MLGAQDLVMHSGWPEMPRWRRGPTSQAAESIRTSRVRRIHNARMLWPHDSFWGRRYPIDRSGA